MRIPRVAQHLLFWLCYYLIGLFNAVFLSESYAHHPDTNLLLLLAFAELLLLLAKAIPVYFILYQLIPRWNNSPKKYIPLLQALFGIMSGALFIRLFMHFIVWPFVTHNNPVIDVTNLLARYFYSLLDLLQIAGVAVAIKLYKLQIQALKREQALSREKLQSELRHLKAQINPHFLFNSLNSIYSLALSRSDLTAESLMRLSKILRYMLYEAPAKTVPLANELRIMEDYITLQQLRFGTRIVVNCNIPSEIPAVQIAPLLLLPLIENAYKHSNSGNACIELELTIETGKIIFNLSNPVVVRSVKIEGEGGIGLKNIERQLQLLYTNHQLSYRLENGKFDLHLMIDTNTYAATQLPDTGR